VVAAEYRFLSQSRKIRPDYSRFADAKTPPLFVSAWTHRTGGLGLDHNPGAGLTPGSALPCSRLRPSGGQLAVNRMT